MMLLTLTLVAAAAVLANGLLFAINRMNRHTAHGVRIAWILMATGALGVLLGPVFDRWKPSLWDTALLVGLALYMICERRRPAGHGGGK